MSSASTNIYQTTIVSASGTTYIQTKFKNQGKLLGDYNYRTKLKLQEESKVVQVEKEKHEATIPDEWLAKYQRMRNKVQNPIVPVINKSCSACYYSVPPQDMMRLKNRALLYCRSCYRLLYHDQEEENDLQKASF